MAPCYFEVAHTGSFLYKNAKCVLPNDAGRAADPFFTFWIL
jgi:hypothetical protein